MSSPTDSSGSRTSDKTTPLSSFKAAHKQMSSYRVAFPLEPTYDYEDETASNDDLPSFSKPSVHATSVKGDSNDEYLGDSDDYDTDDEDESLIDGGKGHVDFESLDYDNVENSLWHEKMITVNISSRTKQVVIRWILTFFVGFVTAMFALGMDLGIRAISFYKFKWMFHLVESSNGGFWAPFLAYVGMNVGLCAISGAIVVLIEPVAGGSGIPEIKCYLNGIKIPHVVRLQTLFAKVVGVVFSVAGGLAVGKEGPMIHTGSVVAAGLSQGASSSIGFSTPFLKEFRNDREKRDFVSGGAAAGVAAAFGAPIGGVLFALEEGSSFWNQELTWRTFFCAIVSVFTLNFFLSGTTGLHEWGGFNNPGLVNFGQFGPSQSTWVVGHMPFFIIIAAFGGLLGALFNAINLKLTVWRRRRVHTTFGRWAEVVLVALLTASLGFLAPFLIRNCVEISGETVATMDTSFYCPKATRNSMASVFFVSFEEAIRVLFHDETRYDRPTLLAFFLFMFLLTVITYGIAVPSGLFVPSLLMGATLGRLIGGMLKQLIPSLDIDPGTFALIGAAAVLGGVVRMTISLTVILMESTNDMSYALPLMITLMVAKFVGDLFNNGLYDLHIEVAKVPLLGWEPPFVFRKFRARDVMSRVLVTVSLKEKVSECVAKLIKYKHNGFPVMNATGQFVGIILRSQIIAILKARAFFSESDASQSRRYAHLSEEAFLSVYPRCPSIHDMIREDSSLPYNSQFIHMGAYLNRSPFTVLAAASLSRVFRLFRTMGLRHLVVMNLNGGICGLVTRTDLVHLHARLLSSRQRANP